MKPPTLDTLRRFLVGSLYSERMETSPGAVLRLLGDALVGIRQPARKNARIVDRSSVMHLNLKVKLDFQYELRETAVKNRVKMQDLLGQAFDTNVFDASAAAKDNLRQRCRSFTQTVLQWDAGSKIN